MNGEDTKPLPSGRGAVTDLLLSLHRLDAEAKAVEQERAEVIRKITAQSRCAKCQWISNPRGGIIPTCRDIEGVNYSRRITEVNYCKRFPAKAKTEAAS